MSRPRPRTFAAVIAVLLGVVASPVLADESQELMQQGKTAFESQCLTCHKTFNEAIGGYRTAPSVQKLVADMVAKGAVLDEQQQAAVVEYLSGRMLLMAKCQACHTVNRPLTVNKSREQWKSTIESMAARMPKDLGMTPEKIEKLAVFLAVERPPR